MEADSTSNSDQTWQNGNLVKRLMKTLLQPGVISFKLADDIISRTRNMTAPSSPVLMRLVKRGERGNDRGGEPLQLVNAHWIQKNKNRPLEKEEVDNGPLLQPTVQYKTSASVLPSNRTIGEIGSKPDKRHLPSVKAVSQTVCSGTVSEPTSTADLQLKKIDSEAAVQGKMISGVGTENITQYKKSSSVLPGNQTSGNIGLKTDERHLPTVQAVSQAVCSAANFEPTSTTDLQLKEVDSEAAVQGKTTGSTGADTGNTLQYKKKSSDLSTNLIHEAVKPNSGEQSLDKEKNSTSLHTKTVRQVDSAKWKISRRGLVTTQVPLPENQKKTAPVTGQLVIKKKSDNTISNTSAVIHKKGIEGRETHLAEDKGVNVTVSNDNMISGQTAVVEQSVLSPESILHTSIALPIIQKNIDRPQKSSKLIAKRSFPEPVVSRRGNSPASSTSSPLSENAKDSVPEVGINLEAEKPFIVSSTSEQLQRAPALIWRNNDAKTTPASISPGQPAHPVKKTVAVSMNSTDQNMLSLSNQAASSHGAGPEANSVDTIENTIPEPRTGSGTSGVDLSRIADRVSRILYRKLAVERERRGV